MPVIIFRRNFCLLFNLLSPKSDKHEISLYNINALENRVVTRIEYMNQRAQMSLADISTNSSHYFYLKSIGVVNENLHFDIRV